MAGVLGFGVVLLVAVLLSDLADRSVLSIAVVFLVAGFVLGDGVAGVLRVQVDTDVVRDFAELALFSVLFTDGMRVPVSELTRSWRLPGLALAVGLPLTLLLTAALAHVVATVPWNEALLLGAALSPTDPVFAAAIVSQPSIPARLRHLLNVESGLNDGLALPVVVVLLEIVNVEPVEPLRLVAEVGFGVILGVAVPLVAVRLRRARLLAASSEYAPLYAFSIGVVLFALAALTHANEFLAAFAGGVTVASVGPEVRDAFHRFGDTVAELLKLAALFVFGAQLSPRFLLDIGLTGWGFALAAVWLPRPLALGLTLGPTDLSTAERWVAAWFGPKGFASVVYGLLIAEAAVPGSDTLVHLIAAVVVLSIVVHSSTDVAVARRFRSTTR